MIRYIFREGEPVRIKAADRADPQIIGDELAKIAEAGKGELLPQAIIDAAQSKKHSLHPHFEWDDKIAANGFRLEQARNLIRIFRCVDEDASEGHTRAFISVNDGNGVSYRPVGDVKGSVEMQAAVLAAAERDLDAFERRYRELVDVCKIVKAARDAVKLKRDKLESRGQAA